MSKLMEKLMELTGGQTHDHDWMAKAQYRRDNQAWLDKAAFIAFRVMGALEAQGLSQKDLAERMKVSPQQVNKIVQGHENLTLETIIKLEEALGIKIIDEKLGKSGSKSGKNKPAA